MVGSPWPSALLDNNQAKPKANGMLMSDVTREEWEANNKETNRRLSGVEMSLNGVSKELAELTGYLKGSEFVNAGRARDIAIEEVAKQHAYCNDESQAIDLAYERGKASKTSVYPKAASFWHGVSPKVKNSIALGIVALLSAITGWLSAGGN